MLKGILEGIKGILEEGLKAEEVPVLKAHIISAKSMLEGVIMGLEEQNKAKELLNIVSSIPPGQLVDLDAQEAKKELGG